MTTDDAVAHLGTVASGVANDNYYLPVFPNGGPPETLISFADFATYLSGTSGLVPGLVAASETGIAYSDFTDGGAAVGTYATSIAIPVGAIVLYTKVLVSAGFAGDTSAALEIGDGTDADRYNDTCSIFATAATGVDPGDPTGNQYHATAATVTLTVTTAADFTSVSAGSIDVYVYYINTVAD